MRRQIFRETSQTQEKLEKNQKNKQTKKVWTFKTKWVSEIFKKTQPKIKKIQQEGVGENKQGPRNSPWIKSDIKPPKREKKLKEPKTTRFLDMNKMKGRRNPLRVRNKTNQNIPLRINIPLKRKNRSVPQSIGNRLIGSWETAQKHFRQDQKPHRLDE